MSAAQETLVRLPKLADTLVEGTVARWLRRVGDTVASGEPLAEIETDKVSTELVAPASGVLVELAVAEGQTVPVESVIARIGAAGAAPASGAEPPPGASAPASAGPPATPPAPQAPPAHESQLPTGGPRPTSVAARLLAEHGLGAAEVTRALAAAGRLTRADVLRYLSRGAEPYPPQGGAALPASSEPGGPGAPRASADEAPPPGTAAHAAPTGVWPATPAGSAGQVVPLSSMRRAIADHMVRARATIPHGQTVMAADLAALAAWREREKRSFEAREGAPLTYTVCFLAALGRAVDRLGYGSRTLPPGAGGGGGVDVGLAVALDGGLVVPVVRGVQALTLGETARAVQDLAGRARAGRLEPADVQGALLTLTNVGSFGNLTATPIVPLGQLGILAPGVVERYPVPTTDGGLRPGWRCLTALVFDRRLLDDLAADRLLRSVLEQLAALADAPLMPDAARISGAQGPGCKPVSP